MNCNASGYKRPIVCFMSFTYPPVYPAVTCLFLVTHVWVQITYATRNTPGTHFPNFVSLNLMMFCTGVNLGFMPRRRRIEAV
jgi:hypothetical protein